MTEAHPVNPSESNPGSETKSKAIAQHHVSGILDEVLHDAVGQNTTGIVSLARSRRHPMIFDAVLALGLMLAVGGFCAGLLHMYVNHLAGECIKRSDYSAAVALLNGIPLPQYFVAPGSETRELFDQALYLDAMLKLSGNSEDKSALRELEKIEPGSTYFSASQGELSEHFKPAPIRLEGAASKVDQVSEAEIKKMRAETERARAEEQNY
jgi:hypothetical protein